MLGGLGEYSVMADADFIEIAANSGDSIIISESNSTVEIQETTPSTVEITEEISDIVEVYEGGIVVSITGGTTLNADQVNLSPAVGDLTNIQIAIERLFNGFIHIQSIAATSWTINHNLGWEPTYSLSDLAGQPITADVQVTTTQAFVVGNSPFTGKLILR